MRWTAVIFSGYLAAIYGCGGTTAVVATPPLADYSAAVMKQGAAEMKAAPKPCARDFTFEYLEDAADATTIRQCSAMKRFVIDYRTMRRQTRCLKNKVACRSSP